MLQVVNQTMARLKKVFSFRKHRMTQHTSKEERLKRKEEQKKKKKEKKQKEKISHNSTWLQLNMTV